VEILSGGEAVCTVSSMWAIAEEYLENQRKDFERKVKWNEINGYIILPLL